MILTLRPARIRLREIQPEYNLNPARCHRATVSGCTRKSACFHPDQNCRSTTQNRRSGAASRGCGWCCVKTEGCCLSARFSNSRLALKGTEWAEAQVDIIRLKLFKIGALVRISARRVWLEMNSFYPWKHIYARAFDALRC